MPHIKFPTDVPGILGALSVKPTTSVTLAAFLQAVLRGPGPLSFLERERIAARVSEDNSCEFCARTHAATAAHLGVAVAGPSAAAAPGSTPAPDEQRLAALMALADAVVAGGRAVTPEHIAAARAAGLDDEAIHDAVLVAAMMCMLNRYVDGLGADPAPDDEAYDHIGAWTASDGYLGLGSSSAG